MTIWRDIMRGFGNSSGDGRPLRTIVATAMSESDQRRVTFRLPNGDERAGSFSPDANILDVRWLNEGDHTVAVILFQGDIQLQDIATGDSLFCYGCAHSAADEPFPGKPSGERPCCFCIRNPDQADWQSRSLATHGRPLPAVWYDGSAPVKLPMDCHHSLDMKYQHMRWHDEQQRVIEGLKRQLAGLRRLEGIE